MHHKLVGHVKLGVKIRPGSDSTWFQKFNRLLSYSSNCIANQLLFWMEHQDYYLYLLSQQSFRFPFVYLQTHIVEYQNSTLLSIKIILLYVIILIIVTTLHRILPRLYQFWSMKLFFELLIAAVEDSLVRKFPEYATSALTSAGSISIVIIFFDALHVPLIALS